MFTVFAEEDIVLLKEWYTAIQAEVEMNKMTLKDRNLSIQKLTFQSESISNNLYLEDITSQEREIYNKKIEEINDLIIEEMQGERKTSDYMGFQKMMLQYIDFRLYQLGHE